MNNQQAVEEICRRMLGQKDSIDNLEEWRGLLAFLHHYKVIVEDDLRGIPESMLIFPLRLEHFFNLVTQNFCTKELRDFMLQLEGLRQQVQDCQTTIDFWAEKGLKAHEIKSLLIIFSRMAEEMSRNVLKFEATNRQVQKIRESILQVKDNLREQLRGIAAKGRVRSAFEYQEDQVFAIEKIYFQERVREVHSRNQPVRVLETLPNGVQVEVGYNIKNDLPIEVIKFPKMSAEIEELEVHLNSFAAYKELFFSPYFPKFLGSNANSNPDYNLYFMEFRQVRPLRALAETGRLRPEQALARYWCLQLLHALKDMLYMSTYLPQLPLTLDHVFHSLNGTDLFLKNLRFLRERQFIDETHERMEARLLRNFAELVLEMLHTDLRGLETDLDFKFFVETLLSAEQDQRDFEQLKFDNKLTFENIFELDILKRVQRDTRVIGKQFSELFPEG